MNQANQSLNDRLLTATLHAIEQSKCQSLIVALSGGLDSTVLLHLCARLKCSALSSLPIAVVHINHGISKHAQQWQDFCRTQAEGQNFPFHTVTLSLSKQKQISLEAQARDARYKHIEAIAANTLDTNHAVLLAQHQNDQAETLLLQLARGAGPKGLSGMPRISKHSDTLSYVRPLLDFTRQQLLDYALEYNLDWIEDDSNSDQRFDRNYIRHSVMPTLSTRWPHISRTISRSAQHCAEAQTVIDEYMSMIYSEVVNADETINLNALTSYSEATQKSFLRHWLWELTRFIPSSVQLDSVHQMLTTSNSDAPYLQFENVLIERYEGRLILHLTEWFCAAFSLKEGVSKRLLQHITGQSYVLSDQTMKNSDELDITLPKNGVKVEFGATNLKAQFDEKRPRKTLKVWFKESTLSPLTRKRLPIFVKDNIVIAACIAEHNHVSIWKNSEPAALELTNESKWYLRRHI